MIFSDIMASDYVSLQKLLSTCYSLSSQACGIIRSVQAKREEKGAAALNATLKDKNDSRTYLTEADTAAQEMVWNGLRAVFGPRLNIVWEEDVIEEGNDWTIKDGPGVEVLNGYDIPTDLQKLVFSDVVVFIDPVDGTREFVEGRLDACQNLIGISYRGRAVAGVVGLPFTRYCTDLPSIL
jgi:3'-phosphoadenosine 5'-phosphosulfate (PAPS) 3'-phosphatase